MDIAVNAVYTAAITVALLSGHAGHASLAVLLVSILAFRTLARRAASTAGPRPAGQPLPGVTTTARSRT